MTQSQKISKDQQLLINHMVDFRQYSVLEKYLKNKTNIYNEKLGRLIQLGQAYLSVNVEEIIEIAPKVDRDFLIKTDDLALRTYAYAHYMNHQFESKEYMDYFRGLSPLLVDLFRLVIQEDINLDINEYIEPVIQTLDDGRHLYKGLHWREETIESHSNIIAETWKKYYGDRFNYSHYVSSSHLMKLIDEYGKDRETIELCNHLRLVEKQVRNIVAHEAIYVSEKIVYNRSQFTIEEIHEKIQRVCLKAGLQDKRHWAILNELDKDIKEYIN